MDAFRDHADGGVQESYMVSHFSERVVMNTHRLIDPLIARRLVGDIRKQLLQARSRCEAFTFAILRIEWLNRPGIAGEFKA